MASFRQLGEGGGRGEGRRGRREGRWRKRMEWMRSGRRGGVKYSRRKRRNRWG